jgi:TolA-binding protein
MDPILLKTLLEAAILAAKEAAAEIKDQVLKKKIFDFIEKLQQYVRDLEFAVNNRDKIIKDLRHEIERLNEMIPNLKR